MPGEDRNSTREPLGAGLLASQTLVQETMTLQEAMGVSWVAMKHMTGEVPGVVLVSKANFAAGYYKDFKPDDPARRLSVCTSSYWGYGDYPGQPDPLTRLAEAYGPDGWIPSAHPADRRDFLPKNFVKQ
jgi:hypothetical protein